MPVPDPAKLAAEWLQKMLASGEVAEVDPELVKQKSEELKEAVSTTSQPSTVSAM